ncbi:restriction endonuclease type II-like protein [Catenaria anguillulae PL171]|uniref:Crossover junction endonuclease MUS81 n=1 Tax=Catenaria anguillulae PL171 TaxID=765915 RepID=A0A1Y2HXS9_9FUNG|nr:restriction endonuclease type II-like protein [Catenaria anguillulae PL171]
MTNRGATALSTLDRRAASDQQPSHWTAASRSVTPPAPSLRTVFSLASPSPEHNPLPSARPPASTASSSSSRNLPLPPQPTRTVSSSSASSNPSSSIPRSSSSTASSSSSSLPRVPSTTPAPSTFAAAATTAANEEAIPDAPGWGPTPIVTLPPESYDIVILLDNREQSRQDREFFQRHLQNQGVFVDTVTLPVGDMAWAARPREGVDGPLGTLQRGLGPQTYVLLDYIAERKRIDDLRTSIHDNRWIEQKWRLEGSALTNLHYIVEEAAAVMQRVTSDPATVKAIMTAKVQTIAWSGFNLHVTRSDQETAELLAQITMMIARLWKPHPLHVVMSEHVKSRADWTAFRKFGVVDSMSKQLVPMTRPQLQSIWHHQGALNRCLMSPHILLSRLSDFSGKSSQVQLRDFFTRMLMTIQGVSAEKARFLVKYFPTPYSLHEAYQKVPEADRPLFLARFFDDLEAQQGMLGRKKIKEALSRRIAEVFTSSQYSDAQVGTDD